MKKGILIILMIVLVFSMAACGKTVPSVSENGTETTQKAETLPTETETTAAEEPSEVTETPEEANTVSDQPDETETGKQVLVVYFSATGTTKSVAEKIAQITDADLYEIVPMDEYTTEDLNWNDSSSRSTKEQNDPSSRPEIGSSTVNLDGYETIYIGYPIWWGEEPRILDTFVESYSFEGITMIPFCTSASSGVGRSDSNLAKNAGSGNWLDGKRFGSGASLGDIENWITSLQ